MIKRKALSNILDNIYLCRNRWLQIKYKLNKQYNEISVCNSTTVHRNTAYDTVENNAACPECGELTKLHSMRVSKIKTRTIFLIFHMYKDRKNCVL